jgi:hypothetical protein
VGNSFNAPMIFSEWISLSAAERETEKRNWHVFEPGYWHVLASEAASQFAEEFEAAPGIKRICKSLYQSDELIVAVQTDTTTAGASALPETYLGFRVVQFAGTMPEGVLVDVIPPNVGGA